MEKRDLGHSGIAVAPLCFGGNVFGWTADEKTSHELLDSFTGAGFNFIDTANSYSTWVPGNKGGESETIIGNWLRKRGRRHDVVIATKVGSGMRGESKKNLAPAYIRQEVEDSLRRLRTDYIDLYQSHYDDPETPPAETLQAYARLIGEGKVRAIGASNFTAARLQASLDAARELNIPAYQTLQPHYNLYHRADYETQLEPFCVENGLSVIPYYSLASGFLTGKYRSAEDAAKSPRGAGAAKMLDERGRAILAALDKVAAKHGSTPASVALAWLMTRPAVAAPIVSASRPSQLDELMNAVQLELDAEDLEGLSL